MSGASFRAIIHYAIVGLVVGCARNRSSEIPNAGAISCSTWTEAPADIGPGPEREFRIGVSRPAHKVLFSSESDDLLYWDDLADGVVQRQIANRMERVLTVAGVGDPVAVSDRRLVFKRSDESDCPPQFSFQVVDLATCKVENRVAAYTEDCHAGDPRPGTPAVSGDWVAINVSLPGFGGEVGLFNLLSGEFFSTGPGPRSYTPAIDGDVAAWCGEWGVPGTCHFYAQEFFWISISSRQVHPFFFPYYRPQTCCVDPSVSDGRVVWNGPSPAPDGGEAPNRDLYMLTASTGAVRQLTHGPASYSRWPGRPVIRGRIVVFQIPVGLHYVDLNTDTEHALATFRGGGSRASILPSGVAWTERVTDVDGGHSLNIYWNPSIQP